MQRAKKAEPIVQPRNLGGAVQISEIMHFYSIVCVPYQINESWNILHVDTLDVWSSSGLQYLAE